MLLIFGTSVRESIMNVVTFLCAYCDTRGPQNVIKRSNRVTLFFIPLFPLSTTYVNQCMNCGAVTPLTVEQARHSLEWASTHRN